MKSHDELALAIGKHILSCYEEWITGECLGDKVVIPNRIPKERSVKEFKIIYPNFSDWIITTEVTGLNVQVCDGPSKYRIIGPKEYFKMAKDLGL